MRLACSSDFSSDNNFMLWEQTVSSKYVPTLWVNFGRLLEARNGAQNIQCMYMHYIYMIWYVIIKSDHTSWMGRIYHTCSQIHPTNYKKYHDKWFSKKSTDLHLGILPLSWYSCSSRIGCCGCFVWIRRRSSLLRRRLLRCGGFCRGRLRRCGSWCLCASRHFHCIDDGHLVMFWWMFRTLDGRFAIKFGPNHEISPT